MGRSPLGAGGLTLLAAVLLGFDGAVLAAIGVWLGRSALVVVGVVLLGSAWLVILAGRQHRRRLDEIAAARRDLRDETEALRRLLDG